MCVSVCVCVRVARLTHERDPGRVDAVLRGALEEVRRGGHAVLEGDGERVLRGQAVPATRVRPEVSVCVCV